VVSGKGHARHTPALGYSCEMWCILHRRDARLHCFGSVHLMGLGMGNS
jgi:hypothetical protein